MSGTIREKLEEYFSSMTPTSSRMMADIKTLKREYPNNWEELNPDQQSDILWKSLIKPEALKMYENVTSNPINIEYFPVLKLRSGEKIIVEEDNVSTRSFGNSWRDEHSAPFRWETMSQLSLDDEEEEDDTDDIQLELSTEPDKLDEATTNTETVTVTEKEIASEKETVSEKETASEKNEGKKEEEIKRPATVKRPEVPPPPVPPHASPPVLRREEIPPTPPPHVEKTEAPIYAKVVKRKSNAKTLNISEMKAHRKAKDEIKPAVPPRMSLELKGSIDVTKYKTLPIDIDDIPKTGFDFLDNW